MLRDPGSDAGAATRTSLLAINPLGAAMRNLQVGGIGNNTTAWRLIRTGDVDGDGRDEVVIMRSDRYRIYTQPEADDAATDTPGAFYVVGGNTNLPFMAVADVDGPGVSQGPTLGVDPLHFELQR